MPHRLERGATCSSGQRLISASVLRRLAGISSPMANKVLAFLVATPYTEFAWAKESTR
jgi:hypothetical protein